MCCIFKQADSFIGNIEKDNRRAKNTAGADDMNIEYIGDAYKQENQHLSADAFEANLAG